MGRGIALLAAKAGETVMAYDSDEKAFKEAREHTIQRLDKAVEKGKISREEAARAQQRIIWAEDIHAFSGCGLVIEAISEDIAVKKKVFRGLEEVVGSRCILATNTSSLPVTAIAGACKTPERVIGTHFFNPADVMPLVEIVPALQTDKNVTDSTRRRIRAWGKTTVTAKDTPGFIVNRIARPFYGEALRIYEEGIAGFSDIDLVMKEDGGFRMGPFELMDMVGIDVNYAVTETIFRAFYCDPRYKPSFIQKRMLDAGLLGRKTGRGFYNYPQQEKAVVCSLDKESRQGIFNRILAMIINEAADVLHYRVASREDIDLAMTKGVNHPKGPLQWADETGIGRVLTTLEGLQNKYSEDRYRPSPLLKTLCEKNASFY